MLLRTARSQKTAFIKSVSVPRAAEIKEGGSLAKPSGLAQAKPALRTVGLQQPLHASSAHIVGASTANYWIQQCRGLKVAKRGLSTALPPHPTGESAGATELNLDLPLGDAPPTKTKAQIKKEQAEEQLERMRIEDARNRVAFVKPFLNQVVKLDHLKGEMTEKIAEIWRDYHKTKYCVCATMDPHQYDKIKSKLLEFPFFVVPLPKKNAAAEFFFLQARGNAVMFTPVAEYKLKGGESRPALTIMNYTELADEKNLVLMRGEIEPANLTPIEAQTLVNLMQAFYLDERRFATVKLFNKDPAKFDIKAVLDDLPMSKEMDLPTDKLDENEKQ